MIARPFLCATVLAATLSGCGRPSADHVKPPIAPEEYAAVQMVRLGYDRWVAVCAYTIGKDGGSASAAQKACLVDFHLPPLKEGRPHDR